MANSISCRMIDTFCIADINIGISDYFDGGCSFFDAFAQFQTEARQTPDILFRFVSTPDAVQYPQSDFYIDPLCFHRTKAGLVYYIAAANEGKVTATANLGWDTIEFRTSDSLPNPTSISLLTDIAFRTRLPEYSGFSLHSSFVEINGTAILFVGPSGIGKSTQADLWHERYAAPIINGDNSIIRQLDNGFHAFGSPWSGTSPYKANKHYPVSAVFLLGQSEANALRLLDGPDVMQGFLPHCLLPYWHKPALAPALEVINTFLQAVPVYQLNCRPDFEAVEMAHAVLTR